MILQLLETVTTDVAKITLVHDDRNTEYHFQEVKPEDETSHDAKVTSVCNDNDHLYQISGKEVTEEKDNIVKEIFQPFGD